jgi:hypothetical protein
LIAWFVLAGLSTVYVAIDQFQNNPEPTVLNRFAGGINCIGRLAANPFGGAICHGDGAGTRPVPGSAS